MNSFQSTCRLLMATLRAKPIVTIGSWALLGGSCVVLACVILGLESGQKLLQAKTEAKLAKQAISAALLHKSDKTSPAPVAPSLRIVGAPADSDEVRSILALISQLQAASNAHDLDTLLGFYSKEFVSGDNLDLKQVRALVSDTWSQYPDMRYTSDLLEVRLNGNWATVESLDHANATAVNNDQLPGQKGQLNTESRSLLFLRRVGKTWVVESDYTVYETARILFGEAAGLNVQLTAPDQVFSGESYTARLSMNIPAASFAIAGIAKEKLVFPQAATEDKFRTLGPDNNKLERVFESNSSNKNEIVTATIGLTQLGRDDKQRPTVALKGIATIVKRINVLARPALKDGPAITPATAVSTATLTASPDEALVQTSADGKTVIGPTSAEDSAMQAGTTQMQPAGSPTAAPPVQSTP
jgi:ketosteroid isomerase-like protein